MLDERPEIIVEIKHEKTQPLFFQRSVSLTVVVVLPEELGPLTHIMRIYHQH